MEPLVSVVVVTYQHAAYIEECLTSILKQETTFPVEILVGEDESTDGTRAICERYAKEHPHRIRLFLRSRKDVLHIRGQATGRANFMALLASAKGKYIAWCEGDDYWTDVLKLQKQVDLLEDDPLAAGSFHYTRVVDKDSKELQMLWREELKERLDLDEVIAPLAAFHSSSFVFRNFPFLKTMPAFFHKIAAGDLGMFALIAGEGDLRRVDGVMSAYRKHTGGITSEAIHLGTRFHIERMRLWMYLDRHFPGRIRESTSRVCGWHWNKIMEHTSGRERLSALRELFSDVPMWFLVRPRYTLYLLRSALPG
jgi:glycosyltransferase involved in cell wall biosynthesis